MNFPNIPVVLVEPQGALNIGSVCRAMKNFGFSRLRMVRPQADYLGDEARRMAVKAADLLETAEIFSSLEECLADCSLALGSTRRFGKYREDFLHPDEAAEYLLSINEKGKTALVFGREDRGLLTSELDLCQRLITIPTSDDLPSMNMAQAVALCLYEVSRTGAKMEGKGGGERKLASGKTLESMYRHMRTTLLEIEYLDPQNPDHILRSYRRVFGRAGLNDREVRILRGLWSRIEWLKDELTKNTESKTPHENRNGKIE